MKPREVFCEEVEFVLGMECSSCSTLKELKAIPFFPKKLLRCGALRLSSSANELQSILNSLSHEKSEYTHTLLLDPRDTWRDRTLDSIMDEQRGFLQVDGLLGRYSPGEKRIDLYCSAIRRFAEEVGFPPEYTGAVAFTVYIHESVHALLSIVRPRKIVEIGETVEELLVDLISGAALRLATIFTEGNSWLAWRALDRYRFCIAPEAEETALHPERVAFLLKAVDCGSGAAEYLKELSPGLKEALAKHQV